jgi:hypothetical protein
MELKKIQQGDGHVAKRLDAEVDQPLEQGSTPLVFSFLESAAF